MTLSWLAVSFFFGVVAMDVAIKTGSLWHWGALIGLYSLGGALRGGEKEARDE